MPLSRKIEPDVPTCWIWTIIQKRDASSFYLDDCYLMKTNKPRLETNCKGEKGANIASDKNKHLSIVVLSEYKP